MKITLISFIITALTGSSCGAVNITINPESRGQVWQGWGTSDLFSFDGLQYESEANKPGDIPLSARKEILKLYYSELGMNFVRITPTSYEPENDNDDPRIINWSAFSWGGRGERPHVGLDPFCEDHLVLGMEFRPKGIPFVFFPVANNWEKWMSITPNAKSWYFGKDGKFDPKMVDEYGEHALAAVLHVKQKYSYEMPYWSLFNEPTNTAKPTKETTLALVLTCGRRFKEKRLKTKLVICDDVTPEASAESIEYVLANEEARGYIGAVAYHRYCGDFVLETVKPMLKKITEGKMLVTEPVSFYASTAKYGIPLWLSEQCSYGQEGITLFDTGRARVNHICDEINNGEVSSFNFMLCYFIERGRPGNEETPIYIRFKDGKYAGAEINEFGYWIRQLTKYVQPSMVRLGVNVDDILVKAVAFQHDRSRHATLVVVNNHPEPVEANVSFKGITGKGKRVRTEQGKSGVELPDITVSNGVLSDTLPGMSITTYSVPVTKGR